MTRADVGGLPPTIRVQEEAVAERLRAASSLSSVEIAVSADLPELEDLSRGAVEQWVGGAAAPAPAPAVSLPGTWGEWGWPTGLVAGLFRAAAAYWRAAPWRLLDNLQIFSARTPGEGGTTWTACVLGNGGEEYGLALYREREDFLAQVESELPSEAWNALRGPVLSLLFEPGASLPRAMQKEILARGWEVAGRDAHPQLTVMNPPEGGVPQAWAEELVAVLSSVPRFVQRQQVLLESGREPEAPVVWKDPETGVELTYTGHLLLADDLLWEPLVALGSALPAGPRADPSAALRGGDEDPDGLYDRELAVVRRFEEFLVRAGRSRTTVEKHVGNATWLIDCLAGYLGVPLVACTEYDLRVFLYDWFPRKVRAPEPMALSLPGSLARFFGFLAEHEGLEFPWAMKILRDREAFEIRYRSFPGGFWWDEPVQEWQEVVYEDLEARVLTPDWEMAGGLQWGATMGATEHGLRR
jgi:hypothetical protein